MFDNDVGWEGCLLYRRGPVVSSFARQQENLENGSHGYHRIEGQRDIAFSDDPHMVPMATTNAAATSLDSKWTPRRQFHTAW